MPQIIPVTVDRHGKLRWSHPKYNFIFASKDSLVPIYIHEVVYACTSLPVVFIKQEDTFMPFGVQALTPNENLNITRDGKWVNSYIPEAYRLHPFFLITSKDGKQFLGVDEETGFISEKEENPFFNEKGELSDETKKVADYLVRRYNFKKLTRNICSLIEKYSLLSEYKITIRTKDSETTVTGLFAVNENALNELPEKEFIELRKQRALLLIYAHLISLQHFSRFETIYNSRKSKAEE